MTSLVSKHGKQCMSCSNKFSVALLIEIPLTETSDFLREIMTLQSFNSVLYE